ncbi:MAG: hypothetical protein U1E87_09515 [Alphaproteobacteria bacterium]
MRKISDGPLARLACPYALPLGFHGTFVSNRPPLVPDPRSPGRRKDQGADPEARFPAASDGRILRALGCRPRRALRHAVYAEEHQCALNHAGVDEKRLRAKRVTATPPKKRTQDSAGRIADEQPELT